MGKFIDETNNQYGRLLVLERAKNEKLNKWQWKCQCQCENKTIVYADGADLRRGHTTSCGCLRRERVSQVTVKDLTGKIFGELEVLSRDMNYQGKGVETHWICQCNACGNVKSISRGTLVDRHGVSCGCLNSKGEYKISKLLNQYGINYIKEFKFSDHQNRRYDFALIGKNGQVVRLIEFDGIQHYHKPNQWLWSQNLSLEEQKARDKEKNQIAKEKNIPLIRIPYWKLETLTVTQLLDNTFLYNMED